MDSGIGTTISLELLAIGIVLTVIFFAAFSKGVTKGGVGLGIIAIGFLFIILAFDPLHDMVLLWILSADIGLICAGFSKNVLPRLWILIGLLGMFLTFILLLMRTGFLG